MATQSMKFAGILLAFQVIFLFMYVFLVDYETTADASKQTEEDSENEQSYYPMFQDVHVMIFIGFGFLMTFLKKYGFSSVGMNMLLAAFVIQWSMLVEGLWHSDTGTVKIGLTSLIGADFAAAAVLISFGAVLGKLSPVQLITMAVFEVVFYVINMYIGVGMLQVVDVGGSMFIHAFGAYFGLAMARVLYTPDCDDSENEGSSYHSDIFSMIGTVFLWMYWPSFNSALAPADDQDRAVINTYLSLAACCVVSFAVSTLMNKGKFDMVHIQNATLAGGVAVGTSADLMIRPWGAILIGSLAGCLSVAGYSIITPMLKSKFRLHDTCGVHNLHGLPGLLGGIAGAFASFMASVDVYGNSMYELFKARAPMANTTELFEIHESFPSVDAGVDRCAGVQAGYQLLALLVTVIVAVIGGVITGFILKLSFLEQPKGQPLFDDSLWWDTPSDFGVPEVYVPEQQSEKLLSNESAEADSKI